MTVPDNAEAKAANHQGATHHRQGRLAEAETCYRRALILCPEFPEALNNLGVLARSRGEFKTAEQHFRDAL